MKKNLLVVLLAMVLVISTMAILTVVPAFADETDAVVSDTAEPNEVASEATEGADAVDAETETPLMATAGAEDDTAVDTVEGVEEIVVDDTADVDVLDGADLGLEENEVVADGSEALEAAAETDAEDTSYLGGTSGIIAIIVAVVILVAAVIVVIALAPKKNSKKK